MKNKPLIFTLVLFCLLFLGGVFSLAYDIINSQAALISKPDIKVVDSLIETKILFTAESLPSEKWMSPEQNSALNWKPTIIPSTPIIGSPGFELGNYAYYQIRIPENAFGELKYLESEIGFAPGFIAFKNFEVFVNGKFLSRYAPELESSGMILIPVDPSRDNIISLKARIQEGDLGINHRSKILLGRMSTLREKYLNGFKSTYLFPLIFILCKTSVVFVFALIYILLNVEKFFEISLLFSLCTIGEDLVVGDFFTHFLSIQARVYLYNTLNIGSTYFLFIFLAAVLGKSINQSFLLIGFGILTFLSYIASLDLVLWGKFMTFDIYLHFWNVMLGCILLFYLPSFWKKNWILLFTTAVALSLTFYNLAMSTNPGLNYKMYGNLIIFFMVAYQSFALFRAEQLDREAKRVQLIEQERDVVVGKAASLLAHDVRRPLEQLKFILEKIEQGKTNPEFITVAKSDVSSSLSNVNEQINSILDAKTPKIPVVEEVSFYKVLNSSVKQIMTINPDVKIDFESDLRAHKKVLAEESRLAGILSNLLANAVEAIRDMGGSSIGKISFFTEIRENSFFFSVTNDGPRIPESIIERIWEPRFTSGKPKGTGLGLESVRRSIESLSGKISVSNIPEGVSFNLCLPLCKTNDDPVLVVPKSKPLPPSTEVRFATDVDRPFRLFLLDDDIQMKDYVEFLCKSFPFNVEVTHHTHYASAKEDVLSRRFDLYLLDYDLGGGSTGVDFYHDCLNYLSKEVVLHTSLDLEGLGDSGFRIKQKPISGEELAYLLESVYKKRKKILFVDDGELFRMAWEMFHGSHNIKCCKTPEEGIAYLKSHGGEINVLVTDNYFDNSSLDGVAVLSETRRLGIPAIMASSVKVETVECLQISKNDFDIRKYRL